VLHGGYWQAIYNLIHLGHLCEALLGAGVASWNLEYRCVGDPGGEWPAAAEDLELALAHVDRLPFPSDGRAVLVGHSAGGQLALWAAKRASLPVVALAPVSDVRDAVSRRGSDSAPARYMAPEHFADGSPLELLPLGVPQILVHGTADDSVPYAMSERYVASAGPDAELVTLDRAGHFEPIDPLSAEWPAVQAAIERLLETRGSDARPR
jgi:pimeloyl-ACP methyl ester carboxylesterase